MNGRTQRVGGPGDTHAEPTGDPGHDVDGLAPGSPAAIDRGCHCSVLANASYRIGTEPFPLADPDCTLHHLGPESPATVDTDRQA